MTDKKYIDLTGLEHFRDKAILNSIDATTKTSTKQAPSINAITSYVDNATTDMEVTTNKTISLSSSSTDTEYPSAKAVYDAIQAGGATVVLSLAINSNQLTGTITYEQFNSLKTSNVPLYASFNYYGYSHKLSLLDYSYDGMQDKIFAFVTTRLLVGTFNKTIEDLQMWTVSITAPTGSGETGEVVGHVLNDCVVATGSFTSDAEFSGQLSADSWSRLKDATKSRVRLFADITSESSGTTYNNTFNLNNFVYEQQFDRVSAVVVTHTAEASSTTPVMWRVMIEAPATSGANATLSGSVMTLTETNKYLAVEYDDTSKSITNGLEEVIKLENSNCGVKCVLPTDSGYDALEHLFIRCNSKTPVNGTISYVNMFTHVNGSTSDYILCVLNINYTSDPTIEGTVEFNYKNLNSSVSASWSDVTGKPFETIGSGLTVDKNALKVNDSIVNHISATDNPHSVTASQVGLDKVGNFKAVSTESSQGLTNEEKANARTNIDLNNVGNFKAVSTVASQGLTDEEKGNARTNIGAGTSSLELGEESTNAYRGDYGKIAYDHSQTSHARSDATKTEASSTNGNIKINDTETTVYTHPGSGTNPHGTTKADIGLADVPNTDFTLRVETLEGKTKLSQFENDPEFIKNTVNNLTNYYLKTETYTQTEVNNLIAAITVVTLKAVDDLPVTGEANIIYLKKVEGADYREQWIYDKDAWVNIGNTRIDLSSYYQKPSTGIPVSDLSAEVVASLQKADTACQSKPDEESITTNTSSNKFSTVIGGKIVKDDVSIYSGALSGGMESATGELTTWAPLTSGLNTYSSYINGSYTKVGSIAPTEFDGTYTLTKTETQKYNADIGRGIQIDIYGPEYSVADLRNKLVLSGISEIVGFDAAQIDTFTVASTRKVPLDGEFIPIDGVTITLNTSGKLVASGTPGLQEHIDDKSNPHAVTKAQVGLGDVGNFKAVSTVASQGLTDEEKGNARTNIGAGTSNLELGTTETTAYRGDYGQTAYEHSQSTHARTDATKTEASTTNGNIKINGSETVVYTHPGSGTNPHGTTKADIGLGDVPNTDFTSDIAAANAHIATVSGNPHGVTKGDVELGNVPNTDFTSRINALEEKTKLSLFTDDLGTNPVHEHSLYTIDSTLKAIAKSGAYSDLTGVPTNLSQFTNDTNFITAAVNNLTNYYLKTETYTQTEVNDLIGAISTVTLTPVDTLPATGETNFIYLLAVSGETYREQWIYHNSTWVNIGNTKVILSGYYTKTETDGLLNAKESTSNKTTAISSSSLDTEYPSAKAVYTYVHDEIVNAINASY